MKNQQNSLRQDKRREKRRSRLSLLGLSTWPRGSRMSATSSVGSVVTNAVSLLRTKRLETGNSTAEMEEGNAVATRDRTARKTVEEMEGETKPRTSVLDHVPIETHQEFTIEEDVFYDDDLSEYRRESLYTLPGAFRVARKFINGTVMEEIALEDVSLGSYSTTKTPPVVVPKASLVSESGAQSEGRTISVPVACPEPHILFINKRHVALCLAGIFLVFASLLSGLLVATLKDKEETGRSTMNPTMPPMPTKMPTNIDEWNHDDMDKAVMSQPSERPLESHFNHSKSLFNGRDNQNLSTYPPTVSPTELGPVSENYQLSSMPPSISTSPSSSNSRMSQKNPTKDPSGSPSISSPFPTVSPTNLPSLSPTTRYSMQSSSEPTSGPSDHSIQPSLIDFVGDQSSNSTRVPEELHVAYP